MPHHSLIRDPAVECETRFDRPYDEQHPGHVVHPNGSLIGSLDRQFLGDAARLVFELYEVERRVEAVVG